MKIFGKKLSEYISFEKWFLVLILVVGLLRLALSLLGVSTATDRFLSLSVLQLIGLVYYSIKVHTSGFGSYKQLLPVLALQIILAHAIVFCGIVISIVTGKENIFSAAEFSPGKVDGKTWGHALSHVVAAIVLPLVAWLIGSLIMFVTKKVTGSREQKATAAQA